MSTSSLKVLIVEDELTNIVVLTKILEQSGFSVVAAENGTEARRMAVDEHPDIILLDLMLPGESGFQILENLQGNPTTSSIPVIIVSALTEVENKIQGLELGAVDYIAKPYERLEVLARVKAHLKASLAQKAIVTEQARRLRQIREAQNELLVTPAELPAAGFDVRYLPAMEAGGDFYDVLPVLGGYGYFVADISGHGLSASMVTAGLKALLLQNTGPIYAPIETLRIMNSVLGEVLGPGRFLTAGYIVINGQRSRLTILSAGHPPLVHVPARGPAQPLWASGDILGMHKTVILEPLTIPVGPGDRIYLYTDGLVEDFGRRSRSLVQGISTLVQACEQVRNMEMGPALDELLNIMLDGSSPDDDVVLMGIEV